MMSELAVFLFDWLMMVSCFALLYMVLK